ncbi:hypothetical protein MXD60_21545 [Frankia sp. AgB32]|nr:hypothetical protein [Frankia sp. AgB32]
MTPAATPALDSPMMGIQPAPSSVMRRGFRLVIGPLNRIAGPPGRTGLGSHQIFSNATVGRSTAAGPPGAHRAWQAVMVSSRSCARRSKRVTVVPLAQHHVVALRDRVDAGAVGRFRQLDDPVLLVGSVGAGRDGQADGEARSGRRQRCRPGAGSVYK